MPSRHCAWHLSSWKRHSIGYPDLSSGRLFANLVPKSGWCTPIEDVRKCHKRVGCNLSEEFSVKIGVYQDPCLCPLLLITVLETLSREFLQNVSGKPLRIAGGTAGEADLLWNTNMKEKRLRVNMGKTNVLIPGPRLDVLRKCGKDPCGVCLKGAGTYSVFCDGWSSWIHKKCSGVPWLSDV